MKSVERASDGTPLCPYHMMAPMHESSLLHSAELTHWQTEHHLPETAIPSKIWRCDFLGCQYAVFEG